MHLAKGGVNTHIVAANHRNGVEHMSLTTGPQLRAARAMARMDQEALAERAGVAANTVRRMEAMDSTLIAKLPTIQRLQRALEAAGIEFTNGDRPGVRMREPGAA